MLIKFLLEGAGGWVIKHFFFFFFSAISFLYYAAVCLFILSLNTSNHSMLGSVKGIQKAMMGKPHLASIILQCTVS